MANLKTTNYVQEPIENKPIRLLSEDEYTQYMQLKRICEFWANIPPPTLVEQDEHVLGLVQTVLGLKSTTWRDITNEDNMEQEPEVEAEAEPEQANKVTRHKSISAKIAFNDRRDLIGKKAYNHMAVKSQHYKDNPYGIPIDQYVECPECGKVAVSGMKITTDTEHDFTDVWQRFRHEEKPHCMVRIERIDTALDWDRVFARKIKYNKRHPSLDTLNAHMYPETEQVPEVEETIDQDANEIESEVTA